MKLLDKLKNVFFEEVPEDEDEEELPQTFAKKIEPKKPVEPVVHEMKREEKPIIVEDEEEVEIEEEEEEEEKKEEEESKENEKEEETEIEEEEEEE